MKIAKIMNRFRLATARRQHPKCKHMHECWFVDDAHTALLMYCEVCEAMHIETDPKVIRQVEWQRGER